MSETGASGEILPPAGTASAGYDASGKSPQEIEHDIGETRAELGAILDALERQLAPRQLLERGVDMLKDTMSGDASGLAETLRSHPIPLALIGAGIGWLLMGGVRGTRVGDSAAELRDRVAKRAAERARQVREKVAGDAAEASSEGAPYSTESAGYAYARHKSGQARVGEAGGGVGGAAQDALHRAREAGNTAWRRAGDYASGASGQLAGARDRMTELIDEHPVAIGALGFLAGALTALLLPRSDVEERWIGPTGERLRDQAASLGRDAAERAQHVAEQTVDAAMGAVKEAVDSTTAPSQGDASVGHAEAGGSTGSAPI